jgi:predicted nucleic acid-binding Zn ribbon protein
MQKITEGPLTVCKSCGGKLKKLISNTSFVLKGSGWYVTDYSDKSKKHTKDTTEKKGKDNSTAGKEPKKEKTDDTAGEKVKKEPTSEPKPSQKSKE